MRTSFIRQLMAEARTNERLFLIVGDLGYHVVEPFAEAFPGRFLNAGIAEQNMAGVAAGLAMTGFNVYIYSIGNFPTLRCLEQIRNDITYHRANVKIISVGAGYAYGSLGATHQATEEIGAMRVLPGMVVATPGDPAEARAVATLSAAYEGPMYIRLGKAGEKTVHEEASLSLRMGDIGPVKTAPGNKKAVLACGSILSAARQQIENEKRPYDLYSVPFVKPLNDGPLLELAAACPEEWVTLEEHQSSCGMGSAIVERLSDLHASGRLLFFPRIRRVAIPDEFAAVAGTQDYLRNYENLRIV